MGGRRTDTLKQQNDQTSYSLLAKQSGGRILPLEFSLYSPNFRISSTNSWANSLSICTCYSGIVKPWNYSHMLLQLVNHRHKEFIPWTQAAGAVKQGHYSECAFISWSYLFSRTIRRSISKQKAASSSSYVSSSGVTEIRAWNSHGIFMNHKLPKMGNQQNALSLAKTVLHCLVRSCIVKGNE